MRVLFLVGVILVSVSLNAQSDQNSNSSEKPKKEKSDNWSFGGYLHNLQTITYVPDFDITLFSTLFHNRFNMRWYATDNLSFGWEQRTRFFSGNDVQLNPFFNDQLEADPAAADLSWVLWSGTSATLHTRIERLWVEYQGSTWEVRAGRQRLNWGVHLFFNPHDVFNTYSFLEIDNPERFGTDAISGTIYAGNSTIEVGYAPGSQNTIDSSTHTAAARWIFNKWTYDFQFLAGWRFREAVSGLGWAGNIGPTGFKGEFAAFTPLMDVPAESADSTTGYVLSLSSDYSFDKPVFLTAAMLYSSRGSNEQLDLTNLNLLGATTADISPSLLFPTKFSLLGQVSWSPTPLLGLDFATIYGPGADLLLFFPGVRYNIANDWDLYAAAQILFIGSENGLSHTGDIGFIRVRWNY